MRRMRRNLIGYGGISSQELSPAQLLTTVCYRKHIRYIKSEDEEDEDKDTGHNTNITDNGVNERKGTDEADEQAKNG